MPPASLVENAYAGDSPIIADVWCILRRRWRLIAGCTLLFLAGAAVLIARQVPTYEATASIRVDNKSLQVPTLELVRLSTGSQIDTEMEMLRSRTLAAGVVDSLALQFQLLVPTRVSRSDLFSGIAVSRDAPPTKYRLEQQPNESFLLRGRAGWARLGAVVAGERVDLPGVSFVLSPAALHHRSLEFEVVKYDDAVDHLRERVKVKRPNASASIVVVTYRDTDRQLVRHVPNILAARLIAERREVLQTETRSTAQFLRDQIAKLSEELRAAEHSLRSFREAERVVSLADQARSAISQSAELQAQRSALDSERRALAQLLAGSESSPDGAGTARSYRDLVAFPSLLRNQAVAGLLTSLASVEDRRTELLSRRRPTDPEVQILTERIQQIEHQLHSVTTTYLQGLTNQVQALDAALAQSGAQMATIPAREIEAARLQREAQTLQEIVTLLTSRLKEAEIAEAVEDPSVRLVDAPRLPTRPASPKKPLILGASLCFGLLLGVAIAFAREYMDGTVHTRGDTQIATGVPVLGLIPRIRPAPRNGARAALFPSGLKRLLAGNMSPGSSSAAQNGAGVKHQILTPASDAYDRLHTNVLFAHPDAEPKTLLVTSPLPGDGKTTTAINLAITLAQRGLRVLLIDADLRRGLVHRVLQVPRTPGLTEVLTTNTPFQVALHTVSVGNATTLHVLAAGDVPANPAQILGSSRMRALLDRLGHDYDRIILDSSPVNLVADVTLLARQVEGTILVARAGVTPFEALLYTAEQFRNANLPLMGTVLNDIDFERDASYDPAYRWSAYGKSYYAAGEPE